MRSRDRLMHDGESLTRNQAILRHAGEATPVINNHRSLSHDQKSQLITFPKLARQPHLGAGPREGRPLPPPCEGQCGVLRPALRSAARAVLRLTLVLSVLGGLLLLFETRFIYFPSRTHDASPAGLGLKCEEVWLTAEDGVRLHAWLLPVPGARWTVLLSHGNAGNISHRLDRALFLQNRLGASVLLYDYRGYGKSEGSPDEAGTYRDARAAYRHLVEETRVPPERLVLLGESLGSAVSLELALAHPAAALILEAPFTSVPAMARQTIFFPLAPFVRTRYDNLEKVGRLRMPLLVLQGDRDEVVPFAQGRRLYEAAPGPKHFFAIPGAGHNDTYLVGGEAYWRAIADFLAGLPERAPGPPGDPSRKD